MSDDKKSIKIMAVDPGTVNFGYATFMMDENGNVVLDQMATYKANRHTSNGYSLEKFLEESPRPKINMHGPMGPPGWIPSDAFPPGFPFWDIPTTLILTDPRLKIRLQYLFAREYAKIPYNKTGFEWLWADANRYEEFCGKVVMWEPPAEERETLEQWLVKNPHPIQPTYNPRFSIQSELGLCHGTHRYAHVDDIGERRLQLGRWLDYQRRAEFSDEMVKTLTPQYKPVSLSDSLKNYPESKLFGSVERSSPDSLEGFERRRGWPIDSITITRGNGSMGWSDPKKEIKFDLVAVRKDVDDKE